MGAVRAVTSAVRRTVEGLVSVFSSIEQTLFLLFFLAFVGFAVHWFSLIFR